jgi:hypothetical protein
MDKVTHINEAQYSLFDLSDMPITPLPSKDLHPHDKVKLDIVYSYLTNEVFKQKGE